MINHKRGFHHNCSVLLRSRSVSSMSQLTARPAAVMSREKRRAEVGEGGTVTSARNRLWQNTVHANNTCILKLAHRLMQTGKRWVKGQMQNVTKRYKFPLRFSELACLIFNAHQNHRLLSDTSTQFSSSSDSTQAMLLF